MANFHYRATNAKGQAQAGELTATTKAAAFARLRQQGLTPLWLEAGQGPVPEAATGKHSRAVGAQPLHGQKQAKPDSARWPQALPFLSASNRITASDIQALTHEMAVMLRAGLPLDRALKILIDMSPKPAVSALLSDILKGVKAGKGLSQALLPHQAHFGDFYISMIRSGEMGGQLAEVLTRLSEHQEKLAALRQSVISALTYPAILTVVALLSIALMLGFVVPQFETLFNDMGDALPWPTQMIVWMAAHVQTWGLGFAVLGVVLGVFGARALKTPQGQAWWHRRALGVPILGPILRKYELTRFARSMGTLLGNGVSMVTALTIAAQTVGNPLLRQALAGVGPAIKQGRPLHEALSHTGLFTPLGLNMVRLGEETGRVDGLLLELARVHDTEVQNAIRRALTLLEPIIILGMGAVIALIIISILMGILSVNELVV
jgi:general secretion pathway protein F